MTTQFNNTIKRIFSATNTTVIGTSPYSLQHPYCGNYELDTTTVRPFSYDEFLVIGTRQYALGRRHNLTKKQAMRARVTVSPINQYYIDVRGVVTSITHKVQGSDLVDLATGDVTASIDTKGHPYYYTTFSDTFELEFSMRRGYSISVPTYASVEDTIMYRQANLIKDFKFTEVNDSLGIVGRIGISFNPINRIGVVVQSPYGKKLFKDLNSNGLPAELDIVQDLPIGQVVKLNFTYTDKLNSFISSLISEYYR